MNRYPTVSAILIAVLSWGVFPPKALHADPADALEQYVHEDDGAYAVEVVDETTVGPTDVYTVKLTSQTWRGREWTHWLSIVLPKQLRHESEAILVIAGGRNNADPPDLQRSEAQLVANIAAGVGAPAAVVQQIPNQPLFDGRREDDLIAYTFDHYLESGESDWPALLPMVKGAVRAMDGVRDVLAERRGLEIERFIVAGGSKRGWTTYLTGAVDDRVKAMAPLVFDVLDMEAQIDLQQRSYGDVSRMIREYAEHGVIDRIDTERGRALQRIVDPFHYRDRMTMPKLIVLGTNDPYWAADSASLYVDALPGPTYLHYVPNTGHGLGHEGIPTVLAFLHAMLDDEPLPALNWQHDDDGSLVVTWEGHGTPRLYEARSDDRDFREAQWAATDLAGDEEVRILPNDLDVPENGWLAYFVQIELPGPANSPLPYALSTPITVLPDKMPP